MDRKEEILKIADALFSSKGYHLSMADIANNVNIKVASIYSHYAGKDEIILKVVENEIIGFYHFIMKEIEKMEDDCCEKKLKTLFFLIINYFSNDRLCFWKNISLIQNDKLRKTCRGMIEKRESVIGEVFNKIFQEGIDAEEIKYLNQQSIVLLYIATIKGILDIIFISRDSDMNLQLSLEKIWNEYWFAIKNKRA